MHLPWAIRIREWPEGKKRSATPLYYLIRLGLMNEVFGADVLLEGVGIQHGRPYIVISQGIVRGATPSCREISEFMTSMNFTEEFPLCWRREEPENSEFSSIIVSDTKPENFVKAPAGVVPIDVIIGYEESEY